MFGEQFLTVLIRRHTEVLSLRHSLHTSDLPRTHTHNLSRQTISSLSLKIPILKSVFSSIHIVLVIEMSNSNRKILFFWALLMASRRIPNPNLCPSMTCGFSWFHSFLDKIVNYVRKKTVKNSGLTIYVVPKANYYFPLIYHYRPQTKFGAR